MVFFFGFRGYTCDDWIAYYPAFQSCSIEDINITLYYDSGAKWLFEPGFTVLMLLCKSIFNDFHFFTLICTCINTILLFRFLKKYTVSIPFGMMMYLCFGGYGMNTNMMRNSIAILIFINAIEYIEKRQIVRYFLMCTLALSFHISSFIYFPLYFFINRKCNKWIYASIFIICNIIFLLQIPVFVTAFSLFTNTDAGKLSLMVDSYTDSAEFQLLTIGYLERLFSGILIFCYYDKLLSIRNENKIFINSFIAFIFMSFILSEFQVVSLRMAGLFIFSYWVLWGDLIKCFSIVNNRKLFMAFIGIYCSLKIIGSTNMITSEYDNILFGAKSYEERLYLHNRYSKE